MELRLKMPKGRAFAVKLIGVKKMDRNQVLHRLMEAMMSGNQQSMDQLLREVLEQNAPRPDHMLFLKKFKVRADLASESVCGGFDGGFETSLSIHVDQLDQNGFVHNNMDVIQAIQSAFNGDTRKASCEELAEGVAAVVVQLLGDRLLSIRVRVYNLTGNVEMFWQQGFRLPRFPRVATRHERDRPCASHSC